jgi:hypothetical protein
MFAMTATIAQRLLSRELHSTIGVARVGTLIVTAQPTVAVEYVIGGHQ